MRGGGKVTALFGDYLIWVVWLGMWWMLVWYEADQFGEGVGDFCIWGSDGWCCETRKMRYGIEI